MASRNALTSTTLAQPLRQPVTFQCCIRVKSQTSPFLSQSKQTQSFSTSRSTQNWLQPKLARESSKSRKGRPHVATGGSVRGTTLVWGDYGIRLKDHDRRISAKQLKIADDTIRKRLRGMKFVLYHRVAATIGVYTHGNDQRMGKGKGAFDYWAARVGVSRILFELKGDVHEQVVRDAMRLAGNKLPGTYEFVRKGDPPVMGLVKLGLNGVTEESLRRPRLDTNMPSPNLVETAGRIPSTTPTPPTTTV